MYSLLWLTQLSEFVPDLLFGDSCELSEWNSACKSLRLSCKKIIVWTQSNLMLTITFTKINGIKIIAVVQPCLDKSFRGQHSRGFKTLKLRSQKILNFLVELIHRLLREDFTARSYFVKQESTDLKIANLRKPQSNSSWASFFFPQISISLAFAIPTRCLSNEWWIPLSCWLTSIGEACTSTSFGDSSWK